MLGEPLGLLFGYMPRYLPWAGDVGVTVLAINLDARRAVHRSFPVFRDMPVKRFELATPDVLGPDLWLNGSRLELSADDSLPEIRGVRSQAALPTVILPPLSYSFFVFRAG